MKSKSVAAQALVASTTLLLFGVGCGSSGGGGACGGLKPLPSRQRAAVVLMDLLDLPSEEAARILGVKAVTVRVLAARARATLRKDLGEDDG